VFPQAVPALFSGKFTAIPRTDADLGPPKHLQAIANTAGFHMPTIEQGGNSLYPSMAQRATSVEVLRILISIGPTETMHFQTWSDKAVQCTTPDRSNKWTGVSRSEFSSLWGRNLSNQSDHARTLSLPKPKSTSVLDHPAY
jgi:hypothetical protein